MKCNVCGRHTQNEEANFCDYCGSPFREHMQAFYDIQKERYAQEQNMYSERTAPNVQHNMQQESKPVSFLDFLVSYGLFFIPFAGWLIFIIMLFIWAFSNSTPPSKKNWARATLIFVGVLAVFMILYLMYIITSPIFQDMMSGAFDYNQYIQSLK